MVRHIWRPDMTRTATGTDVCAREGCDVVRRPSTRRGGKYEHRTAGGSKWSDTVPPCMGQDGKRENIRRRVMPERRV